MDKNSTSITINGKQFSLTGYEEIEYLQRIAAYLNAKTEELKKKPGFTRQPVDFQAIILELNLVDDYLQARKQVTALEAKVDLLEKELYNLKHELVNNQLRYGKRDHEEN